MQEVWSLEGRMEAHSTSQWLRLGGICRRKFFLREKYLTWKYKKQFSSVILCEITSHRTVFHIFWKLYFPFRRICHCATYARGFGRWQRVFFWNASLPPCLFKHWWMGEADEKWQVLEIFFFYSFPPSLFLLSSEKSVFNQAVPAPGGRSWVFLFFFFFNKLQIGDTQPSLEGFHKASLKLLFCTPVGDCRMKHCRKHSPLFSPSLKMVSSRNLLSFLQLLFTLWIFQENLCKRKGLFSWNALLTLPNQAPSSCCLHFNCSALLLLRGQIARSVSSALQILSLHVSIARGDKLFWHSWFFWLQLRLRFQCHFLHKTFRMAERIVLWSSYFSKIATW